MPLFVSRELGHTVLHCLSGHYILHRYFFRTHMMYNALAHTYCVFYRLVPCDMPRLFCAPAGFRLSPRPWGCAGVWSQVSGVIGPLRSVTCRDIGAVKMQ